jgi:hypothetical protein
MTAVTVHPLAPRKYRRALIGVLTLVFLGVLSLAALLEMKVECRNLIDCLGANSSSCLGAGPSSGLGKGNQTRQCEVSAWGLRSKLSERVEAILRELGVRFFYI